MELASEMFQGERITPCYLHMPCSFRAAIKYISIHFNISCLTLVRVLETVALPLGRSTLKLSSNSTLYVTHRHGIGLKQVYKTPLGHFADSNFFSKE